MIASLEEKILEKLREWEDQEGPLPTSIEFYRRVLRCQSDIKSHISTPRTSFGTEAISSQIRRGFPLLVFDDLLIDWSLLQDTFRNIAALVAEYTGSSHELLEKVKDLSPALLKDVTRSWFEGDSFPPQITTDDMLPRLDFMLRETIRPVLTKYSEVLLDLVNQESWRRGYCPICGGVPDFAFLEKEQGARWLMCSRCDARWLFQRLECPYCGSQDQNTLAYFTDDKEVLRLYTCEKCRHYLKAIDFRRATCEVLLPLERYLTMDIDIQARSQGYTPARRCRRR